MYIAAICTEGEGLAEHFTVEGEITQSNEDLLKAWINELEDVEDAKIEITVASVTEGYVTMQVDYVDGMVGVDFILLFTPSY